MFDHYRKQALARSGKTRAAMHALHGHIDHGAFERVDDRLDSSTAGLEAAMATLSPRHQEALRLRYVAGLSLAETAAAMQCSKGTMSVTVHRAVSALRAALIAAEGELA